ncbi:hypothetical protein ACIQ6Y_12965 [Streptomyces sp. NPDC096205]|uniref:hypothetical protein n=1 Tax=Streptomyces sp. NPDC096205 TaxID=3366081 RepID=UPI003815561D
MTEDPEGDSRGRIRKHVGWWIGVIAGLCGIAGLIFSITTKDEFTLKEWRQQADAVCDDLSGSLLDKWATAAGAVGTLEEGGYQSADYQSAADAWLAAEQSVRKLTSEIGKIEMPNSHKENISRLLDDLTATGNADGMLAVDLGTEVLTEGSEAAKDRHDEPAAKAQQDFKELDVSHCFGFPPSD